MRKKKKEESHLRYFVVTTFHDQLPRQHETEPVLYLAIVIAGCADAHRADYYGLAIKISKEKLLKLRMI